MLARSVFFAILVTGAPVYAQQRQATPEVLPTPGTESTGGPNGPASDEPEKPKAPAVPAAGYAYGNKPAKGGGHAHYRSKGPVVNMPGFEESADGSSRLFVQLSQNVPVEEHKAQGSITYVLKGASPRVWNNTNALVTVHFNTPVTRAKLVPHGHDLHFVVDLRSSVTPTWKMSETADKTATLTIDFPKGDYLGAPAPPPQPAAKKKAPVPKH
jgi:hypothetical protein